MILKKTFLSAAFTLALLASTCALPAANWPAWRGPSANGISLETNAPMRWSPTDNVRWKTALPEPGNSTPITWGERIFLTQPIAKENRRTLLCLDRQTGKQLWQSGIVHPEPERTHETNPYASASPVTDGERVICWFGSGGLVAYDFSGKELWRTDLGKQDHQFGYGGSPVLHGDLCFLNFGPGKQEFLVAIDKRTGKEVWRHTSPTPGGDDIYGNWSTPLLTEVQGKPILINNLRNELAGMDPATGKIVWVVTTNGIQSKTSPVAGEGVVVMASDMKSAELAVKLGGAGNVTLTHVLWRKDPPKRRIGTSVIFQGMLFGTQVGGLADCVDLLTGKIVWEERLKGSSANTAIWSSPVLVGNTLYVMNQGGDVFALRAGRQFELLATQSLGEKSNSDVVPSNGGLLLRTHQALWCVGGETGK